MGNVLFLLLCQSCLTSCGQCPPNGTRYIWKTLTNRVFQISEVVLWDGTLTCIQIALKIHNQGSGVTLALCAPRSVDDGVRET